MNKLKKQMCLVSVLATVTSVAGFGQTGNGAPSGPHYELNIIGVPQAKTANMTNSNRHTIFVALGSKNVGVTTDIWLTQGEFQVCDGNGFDLAYDCSGNPLGNGKYGAVFQLPCNTGQTVDIPCVSGQTLSYTVWARALGQPGGNATITTCAFEVADATTVCSTQKAVLMRYSGKQTFKDVTSALTTIQGTDLGSVDLFAPGFTDFLWQYDNNGLRLAQVRFYAK